MISAPPNGAQDYQTLVGGREVVPLPDGSRLELNTDTEVVASISDRHRIVKLEKGEAFF